MKITSGRCVARYSSACSADSAMSTSRLCCSSMRERTTRADLESSTMSARLEDIAGFRREGMWVESVAYFHLGVCPGPEHVVGTQRQRCSALACRRCTGILPADYRYPGPSPENRPAHACQPSAGQSGYRVLSDRLRA